MNFKKCPKWFLKKQSQIDTKQINWILVGLSSNCTLTRDEGVVGFDSKINRGTNSSKWRLFGGRKQNRTLSRDSGTLQKGQKSSRIVAGVRWFNIGQLHFRLCLHQRQGVVNSSVSHRVTPNKISQIGKRNKNHGRTFHFHSKYWKKLFVGILWVNQHEFVFRAIRSPHDSITPSHRLFKLNFSRITARKCHFLPLI